MQVNPKISIFNEVKHVEIPKNKKYVFVSDHFDSNFDNLDKTIGILANQNNNFGFKLKTKDISHNILEENRDKLFVFGGLNTLNWKYVADLISANRYCIIESELKFCKHKSPEKHKMLENTVCNCHNEQIGKVVEEFYLNAEMIFWFSEEQKNIFHSKLPKLKNASNQTVMPQIFDEKEFNMIDELVKNKNSNGKYCVLNTNNLLDGTFEALKYANELEKKTELINFQDFNNDQEFLAKISNYDGIVYTPNYTSISPRFLIQSKLLGLDIITKETNSIDLLKENWFHKSLDDIKEHVKKSTELFNKSLEDIHNFRFSNKKVISGYVVFDKTNINYFEQFINNFSPICDEILVGLLDVDITTDKNNILFYKHQNTEDNVTTKESLKDLLRQKVTSDYILELSPEYVPENNFKDKLNNIINFIPKKADFFCLPILTKTREGKYRQDKHKKYWREILSRNISLQVKHKSNEEINLRANNGLVTYIDAVNGNLNIYLDFTQNVKAYDHLFYDMNVNNLDNYIIFNRVCETLAYKYPTINILE